MVRSKSNLADIQSEDFTTLDYMFERPYFITSLSNACPQIHLYNNEAALTKAFPLTPANPSEPNTITSKPIVDLKPIKVVPRELVREMLDNTTLIAHPEKWRPAFFNWLKDRRPSYSAQNPVVVAFSMQLLRFPLDYDPPAFSATFGRILLFRADLRVLAAKVLYSLSNKYSLSLDPTQSGLGNNKFVGAHLRTAEDAIAVGWPNYQTQSYNYLFSSALVNNSLIYLTNGNPVDGARFEAAAARLDLTVTSRDILLAGPEFQNERWQLGNMTWDQQALVDYEVLSRSATFLGMYQSSFSWNVALRRHVIVGNGTWLPISMGHAGVENLEGSEGSSEAFRDDLSRIFGPRDLGGIRWQFPLGLYP